MASTGSSLEAAIAGIIPDITPTMIDNPEPIIMFSRLNTNSKSNKLVSTIDIIQTKNNPIIPPITQRTIASNKN